MRKTLVSLLFLLAIASTALAECAPTAPCEDGCTWVGEPTCACDCGGGSGEYNGIEGSSCTDLGWACTADADCCSGKCDTDDISKCFDCYSCSGVTRCSTQEITECEAQCGADAACDDRTVDSTYCSGTIEKTCTDCISGSDGCEANCGAASACDELAAGTDKNRCDLVGYTYFEDECSSTCALQDITSKCETSETGCTGSAECDAKTPNAYTGVCTYGNAYREDFCSSSCVVSDGTCTTGCGADANCDGLNPGDACDYCSGTCTACTSYGDSASCTGQDGCSWDPAGPCEGTPLACSGFGTEASCTGQGGCSWTSTGGTCSGICTGSCGGYAGTACIAHGCVLSLNACTIEAKGEDGSLNDLPLLLLSGDEATEPATLNQIYFAAGYCCPPCNCQLISDSGYCTTMGCTWTPGDYECTGTATSCSDFTTEAACTGQSGCSWDNAGPCGETCTACSSYGDSASCTGQDGCNWVSPTTCDSTCQCVQCAVDGTDCGSSPCSPPCCNYEKTNAAGNDYGCCANSSQCWDGSTCRNDGYVGTDTDGDGLKESCYNGQWVEPPTYSNVSDDSGGSVVKGTIVTAKVYWTDNTANGLSYAIMRHNATGSWENVSVENLTGQTSAWFNYSINTSGNVSNRICWNQYANDSSGNLNNTMSESAHCFNITENTAPTALGAQITPLYPTTLDDLTCSWKASDNESTTTTADVTWYKNGVEWTPVLPATNLSCSNATICKTGSSTGPASSDTAPGQVWNCTVTVTDSAGLTATASATTTILDDVAVIFTDGTFENYSWSDINYRLWTQSTNALQPDNTLTGFTSNCTATNTVDEMRYFPYMSVNISTAGQGKFVKMIKLTDPAGGSSYQITAITLEKVPGTYP